MNFIITLPESESFLNIMIVTDKLLKNVLLTVLLNLKIKTSVQSFIKNVFSFYEVPSVIVSD